MICPNCGKDAGINKKTCPHCGFPLQLSTELGTSATQQIKPEERIAPGQFQRGAEEIRKTKMSAKKVYLIISLFILSDLIVAGILLVYFTKGNFSEGGGKVSIVDEPGVFGADAGEDGRSSEDISKVIDKHLDHWQSLYQAQLTQKPELKGTVVFTFNINPAGRVTQVQISSSTLKYPELEETLVGDIYSWQFSEFSGGEIVAVCTFEFNN
jgi:TonB family protein